jgi:hypothetical protein
VPVELFLSREAALDLTHQQPLSQATAQADLVPVKEVKVVTNAKVVMPSGVQVLMYLSQGAWEHSLSVVVGVVEEVEVGLSRIAPWEEAVGVVAVAGPLYWYWLVWAVVALLRLPLSALVVFLRQQSMSPTYYTSLTSNLSEGASLVAVESLCHQLALLA